MAQATRKPKPAAPDDPPPGGWPEPTIESLRQLLLDGINSPIAGGMDAAFFEDLRARIRDRAPR